MSPDKLAKLSTILLKPTQKTSLQCLRTFNNTYTNVWDTIEAGWETTLLGIQLLFHLYFIEN
jgi:hypothetical protein